MVAGNLRRLISTNPVICQQGNLAFAEEPGRLKVAMPRMWLNIKPHSLNLVTHYTCPQNPTLHLYGPIEYESDGEEIENRTDVVGKSFNYHEKLDEADDGWPQSPFEMSKGPQIFPGRFSRYH